MRVTCRPWWEAYVRCKGSFLWNGLSFKWGGRMRPVVYQGTLSALVWHASYSSRFTSRWIMKGSMYALPGHIFVGSPAIFVMQGNGITEESLAALEPVPRPGTNHTNVMLVTMPEFVLSNAPCVDDYAVIQITSTD
ncbi:unnamed protein product [Rhizoctonia solani]|uniref:Uncharacterized protein n=1 Tax=Rhizoctonia solani TaxID=456999 RepID=A0A8H3GVZ7_9AGAM|nr:unnamed protein product [Rhizoctonia solani]